MRGAPEGKRSGDKTLACDRPPPSGGGAPPLPYLLRSQGEDPLAPALAVVPPEHVPLLRGGRPAGRTVRCSRPRSPPTLERVGSRGLGRPPPAQQEPGQADGPAAGR